MKHSPNFGQAKVLIIDDQRAFQITLKGMLTNLGVKDVKFVESSDAAIRACRSFDFDIVLADYNLGPGKNGRQLLEALRDEKLLTPSAIFFIVSGENARGVVLGAIEREPDDYLVKPFSLRQLSARLERALSKRAALGEIYAALHAGDTPLAITNCKSVIEQKGRYSSLCIKLLADLYRRNGELSASEEILRKALKARDTVWARVSLGHTLNRAQRADEVVDIVKPVIKNTPLVVEAQDCLAEAYWTLGESEKALQLLRRAAEMSPYMEERQSRLAEVARDQNEFLVAQEAYKQIFDLSQRAQEKNTEHLCNYVRSTVEASIHTEAPNTARRLETEAINTLSRARQDSQFNGFDFQSYETLINANKWAQRGDLIKAKKLYYKATERYDNKTAESTLPVDFIADGLSTVSLIGELDEAIKLLERAEQLDSKNPFIISTIKQQHDKGTGLAARDETFQIHNRQGMAAYDQSNYAKAIEEFELALKIAPTNTGAALNLIQSLLKSISSSKKVPLGQLKRCRDLFKLVEGVRLPHQHTGRRRELLRQLQQLERKKR